jgi:microcystin-dependent protein
MTQAYYTLLTAQGAVDLTNGQVFGVSVPLTHLAVGDGAGEPVLPTEAMTALVNERFRVPVNSISQDVDNPNWLIVEAVLPANVGGWTVREIGLFGGLNADNIAATPTDPGNRLLAVGNFPETYKPLLSEGSGKDLVIRMIVEVANAAAVSLSVDPSVVVVTRKAAEQLIQAHRTEAEPHSGRYAPLSHLVADDPHSQYYNEARLESRLAEVIQGTLHYMGQAHQIVANADALDDPVIMGPLAGRPDGRQVIVTDYPASATGHALATWQNDGTGDGDPDDGVWVFADLPLSVFDLWGLDIDNHGYYWFADTWNLLDLDNIGDATTTEAGVIKLATAAEAAAGNNATTAITPALLAAFGKSLLPAGTEIFWTGTTPPPGFIEENGALLSRTAYADLWAHAQASGNLVDDTTWTATSWGAFSTGNGSTTFRVPDVRGEFLRCWDNGRGIDAGRNIGVAQGDLFKSHSHTYSVAAGSRSTASSTTGGIKDSLSSSSTGSSGGGETRPRNVARMVCVKY